MGGQYAFEDNREWPNTLDAVAAFGPGPVAKRGFVLQYTMRIGCRREKRSHAKCFLGTEASLLLDRSRYTIVREVQGRQQVVAEGELVSAAEEGPPQGRRVSASGGIYGKYHAAQAAVGQRRDGTLCHQHRPPDEYIVGRWDAAFTGTANAIRSIDDPDANALVMKPYRDTVETRGVTAA